MGDPEPPKVPQPLGLPTGSVRALLALTLCGTLWFLVVRGRPLPTILVEGALLIIAFYFGVRGTVAGRPTSVERQPLFLPRGAVRVLLLVGFGAVVAFAWTQGQTLPPELLLILQVLASYVAGFLLSRIITWRLRSGRPIGRGFRIIRNIIAMAVLGIALFVCLAIAYGRTDLVPEYAESALVSVIAFYFGSRLAT